MTKKRLIITLAAVLVFIAAATVLIVHIARERAEQREREELALMLREYYDAKVAEFERENETLGEVDIAFIGDSITDGYDVAAYYPQYRVINRGIGGDTSFGLEERLEVSLFEANPRAVVMLIGANNIGEMMENYESILIKLRDNLPDSKIVLLSLTAMGKNWGRNNAAAVRNNVQIKALAEKYGYTFVDLYYPLLDEETGELYEHLSEDGGHPNADGYSLITEILTPVLDGLLAS